MLDWYRYIFYSRNFWRIYHNIPWGIYTQLLDDLLITSVHSTELYFLFKVPSAYRF